MKAREATLIKVLEDEDVIRANTQEEQKAYGTESGSLKAEISEAATTLADVQSQRESQRKQVKEIRQELIDKRDIFNLPE